MAFRVKGSDMKEKNIRIPMFLHNIINHKNIIILGLTICLP